MPKRGSAANNGQHLNGSVESNQQPQPQQPPVPYEKERQQAAMAVFQYLTAMVGEYSNKYIKSMDPSVSEQEFYWTGYGRIARKLTEQLDPELAQFVPRYDTQKHGPYGGQAGIQKYIQDLDAFFQTAIEKGRPEVIPWTAKYATQVKEAIERNKVINDRIVLVERLLASPEYSQEAKISYINNIRARFQEVGIRTPAYTENKNMGHWVEFLAEVVDGAFKNLEDYDRIQYAFEKAGDKQFLVNYPKVEAFRETFEILSGTMNRSYSGEFQGLMNTMDEMITNVDSNKQVGDDQFTKLGSWATEYCMRKVHQNKASYDSMEATRLGNVIEVLTRLDPRRGKLMQDVFGMRVTDDGEKKIYSFRPIPEVVYQGERKDRLTFAMLEQNVTANRAKLALDGDNPEMDRISATASSIIKDVKDADPALMRSSPEYRAFRKAAQTLADEMAKVQKELAAGADFTPERKQALLEKTKAVRDSANAYYEYKHVTGLTPTGFKRLSVAEESIPRVEEIEDMLRAPDIRKGLKTDPLGTIQAEVDYLLENRNATHDNLARLMILKSAEKAIKEGTDPASFADVLSDPAKMRAEEDKMLNSNAFYNFRVEAKGFEPGKPMTELNPDMAFNNYLTEVRKELKQIPRVPGPQANNLQKNAEEPQMDQNQPQNGMGAMS